MISRWTRKALFALCLTGVLQPVVEGLQLTLTGSSDCATKNPLCLDPEMTIATGWGVGLSNESTVPVNSRGGWGTCNANEREVNSAWFSLQPTQDTAIVFALVSTTSSDLDFVLWGPFDTADEGCGTSLTMAKNVSCGWVRGPSVPSTQTPWQLEIVRIPNPVIGKYYTLLVNDQTGNTTFQAGLQGNTSGASLNCTFLTAVLNATINGTGNVTSYGTMPVLGQSSTFYFDGIYLDSRPGRDVAKVVSTSDACDTGSSVEVDVAGDDLGPGDAAGLNRTYWTVSFSTGGSYKLCYKPYGFDWKVMLSSFEVQDLRPRPPPRAPGAIPDATDTTTAAWFDFEPKTVVRNGPVEFTFYGFKGQAFQPIVVKVVVESCDESYPSVSGMVPQELSATRTATFSLPDVGRYRVCMKHRAVWEISVNYVQVVNPDSQKVYYGYSSCTQLLVNLPDYCGCFLDASNSSTTNTTTATATNASTTTTTTQVSYSNVRFPASVVLPASFPMERASGTSDFPPINQGCCAHNTPLRTTVGTSGRPWGLCAELQPIPQPLQCL